MTLSKVEQLLAIEDIKRLKARYIRSADTKDWEALRACLHADVECDWLGATTDPATGVAILPGSTEILYGIEQVMAVILSAMTGLSSIHRVIMPEIDVTGPDTARGIWAMLDRLYIPGEQGIRVLKGWGHYHEDYVRGESGWQIRKLRLVRQRVEISDAA
jgi:hypothetical protein